MKSSVLLVAGGLALALALAGSAQAQAQTRRLAVVVGNNAGSGVRPALRYAHSDASKLAEVLVELGGFAPADVVLLRGNPLLAIQNAFAVVKQTVQAARARGAAKVVLLFYFSGHSDGQALEIGAERFAFAELRRLLFDTGADVRVAIVDSCQSGALLAQKSGRPAPSFEIRFTDDMASSGEAFLTSSAAHETALESAEIRGSFFSHHLVSGLRGAADASGDGRVTLGEAYHYAFQHTLTTTTNTIYGPQHPAYDFRLSGQGEVVLTELLPRSAALVLPAGYQRILVEETGRGQVVAELASGGARRLAVPPGPYQIWAFRDGRSFVARVDLAAGRHEVQAADLRQTFVLRTTGKGGPLTAGAAADLGTGDGGGPDDGAAPGRWLLAGGGVRAGVGQGQGPVAALRLGLRPARSGFTANLDLGLGRGPGFQEKAGFLSAGYALGAGVGALRGLISLELGGGAVAQTLAAGPTVWTPAGGLGASVTGSLWVSRRVALVAEASLPGYLLRRDGGLKLVALPVVALGLAAAL